MSRANKLLINEPKTCVDELLDNVAFTNPGLVRLEGHSVILRDDINNYKSTHVTIISGGGSGHEPFPSGFVGKGMLSAAVCGDVFASPSSSEIFAAIQSVSSKKGVILLVANYTGDRLNFGIARERAVQKLGIRVEIIVVGEDCAMLPNDKTAGRRGLVGIVFAMKIAGSMAEEGKSIDNICEVLKAVTSSKKMGTIGLSLSGCSVPGKGTSFKLLEEEMELGLGAHGESGVKRVKVASAKDTADLVLNHMTDQSNFAHLSLKEDDQVCMIINNLGGLTFLEIHLIASRLLSQLKHNFNVHVVRFYIGHLMTSLDMCGFNVNITIVDDDIVNCLDAKTNAPSWPNVSKSKISGYELNHHNLLAIKSLQVNFSENSSSTNSDKEMIVVALSCIKAACRKLLENENFINKLDGEGVGDADCGSTLARGSNEILNKISSWQSIKCIEQVFMKIATSVESSMGGASGGIYSLFFTSAANKLESFNNSTTYQLTSSLLFEAFRSGIQSIQKYGGAKLGDRTMLDALIPACNANCIKKSVEAAWKGAETTKYIAASAGRASYVSREVVANKMDAGAYAIALIVQAISDEILSI